jgi:hypothetical protein
LSASIEFGILSAHHGSITCFDLLPFVTTPPATQRPHLST